MHIHDESYLVAWYVFIRVVSRYYNIHFNGIPISYKINLHILLKDLTTLIACKIGM